MEIKALAEFQSLDSIGPKMAHDLIALGYYSLKDLKRRSPVKLYDSLEHLVGVKMDPCVEDQLRLMVYYANNPGSKKNWWDFTPERKQYREKHGYGNSRPKKSWFELEEYQHHNRIPSKTVVAKKDLAEKIKGAMKYIKGHYTEKITLAELSKIALLSPYHLQRSFISVYEQSPLAFITHLRLKKATGLLKRTKKPVSTIVVQCGFENTSSFIRLFKKRFRQTPQDFRTSENEKNL
ncbi:MAG: helix-hairpin-helix domain-containing protein [Flavisolibacter sp.]